MSDYFGDIRLGETLDVKFTTRQISGAPFTLAGSPVVSAYPANSTTELTAGITLTVDFDNRTGYNNVRVVATSGNGYATATNYDLCITTGTVNGVSVVGESIGSFSIENRSALMPTTAARTLDISATGEAGVDWANVGSPTTVVNLSGTQIQSVNNLAAGTDSINTTATSGSTLTTGSTVSGTYASTAQLDGTYWQIADTAGTLDMYFEFNVGTTGVPTAASWTGALTTAVNTLKVFARNWAGSSWDQIGTINGTTSLNIASALFDFTTAHVGTGGNLGLVRLRFQNTGLTAANFYTDQVLCGYTNVQTFPSNFSALSISAAGKINEVVLVNTLTTYTGDTPQTGDSYARIGNAGAGLTALGDTRIAHLDVDLSSRMATYTQPAGFLAATFPSGTIANTTNITAGTITTVTNLTNAPTNGDLTTARKASINAEADTALSDYGALQPTTAGRKLDVTATGAAGIDWANVENQSTAVNLSATNIDTDQIVASVSGNIGGSVASISTGGIVAGSFAADAIDASALAANAATEIGTAVWANATRVLTAGTNIVLAKGVGVTGLNDLSAAQVNAEADTALSDVGLTTTITGRIDVAVSSRLADADYVDPPTAAANADAVWEEAIADHSGTAGSTAEALGAAGSSGDPWITALPGVYAPGSAGNILGNKLDVMVSTRLADADYSAAAVATAVWSHVVEGSYSAVNYMRGFASALMFKSNGQATASPKFRDAGDTKDRISGTADVNGNRSSVTLDLS